MKWAALILWIITALGGFSMLAIWLREGGVSQAGQPGRRIRPPHIFSHMGLAAGGLVLWIIYLVSDSKALAWIAFVVLLAVASLGFGMLALWLQRRETAMAVAGMPSGVSGEGGRPAEQHFPPGIVVLHGLVAAATLVLVFLAAVGA
jgi:hypothetical protein